MKYFGIFPTQAEIDTTEASDPMWKKRCAVEIDESLQQIDLTPFVMSLLSKVGIPATVYLEDLDIKLLVQYHDPVENIMKYLEVPASVESNYYWDIYTGNRQVAQRYITTYFRKTKHYDQSKGVVIALEGNPTKFQPLGQWWRLAISVKKSLRAELNFNTLLSVMTSRSLINPLVPGQDPTTGYPNNPTYLPVSDEAVYKFLMNGFEVPTVAISASLGAGSDPIQQPVQKVEIRTEMAQIRAKEFAFYSDREYLLFKTNLLDSQVSSGLVGTFIYNNVSHKKVPWRIEESGVTAPGRNLIADDAFYNAKKLKALQLAPELA
jgi:hypothetical protein